MKASQSGFSMIEVLITIAILVVGLLGLAGLQSRVAQAELEAFQRAQALVMMQDMADRISANKKLADNYIMNDIGIPAVDMDCTGMTSYKLDLCDFNNMLIGAAEKKVAAGPNIGGMIGGRACITSPEPFVYNITIAWQGLGATIEPADPCGKGEYGDDKQRRTVSLQVRVAQLSAL